MYSASKGAAETATAAYRRSFFPVERFAEHGVAAATERAGNVIAGGDWGRERIVPDIVRALMAAEPVVLRNPGCERTGLATLCLGGGNAVALSVERV